MKFIEQLPFFYYEDKNVNSIQEALESENGIYNSKIEDAISQLYVNTATWSLELWEKMLDIKPQTGDYEIRRKNIKAKLRSRGVVTPQRLINITKSYTDSEVDLDEFSAEYYFVICMWLNSLNAEEFLELKNIIETIKPCHLDIIYKWMLKQLYSIRMSCLSLDSETTTVYPEDYDWYAANCLYANAALMITHNGKATKLVFEK